MGTLYDFAASPRQEANRASLHAWRSTVGSLRVMRLAASGNVEVPAILLLEERGFVVTVGSSDAGESWRAKMPELELVAESPLQLLGLAFLADARGSSWQATDEQIEKTLSRFESSARSPRKTSPT